jgi:hypothetical protein
MIFNRRGLPWTVPLSLGWTIVLAVVAFSTGGLSILSFGPLLGLLGADESGTQCGILVLSNRYRDCGLGVAGSDDTSSIFVPNWSSWYRFVDSYPARPSNRDHLTVSKLWSRTHNKSNADDLFLICLPKLLRAGSSCQPPSPISVIAVQRQGLETELRIRRRRKNPVR